MSATERPWVISRRPDGSLEIQDRSGVPICVMCWYRGDHHLADAELILRAVNLYDEMVEALAKGGAS